MEKRSASFWRTHLNLIQHVEGGSFREVYRAPLMLPAQALTEEHKGARSAATGIYFLLEYGEFSALHRIASDELWHFYEGDTLSIYEITKDGYLVKHLLGTDIEHGASPQVLIQAGSWFGSIVEREGGYTLCGCTVAPGFDFEDFELAARDTMLGAFPQHASVIELLTHS